MADIFISYASEDRDRVKPLAEALEDRGWSVFWDFTIPVGKTWRQVIAEALDAARCAVVFWSSTSINSDWVHEEADEAKRRRILVPAMIDEIIPPLGFRSMQAARLMNWAGESNHSEFKKLLKSIEEILGPSPLNTKGAAQKRIVRERSQGKEADPTTLFTGKWQAKTEALGLRAVFDLDIRANGQVVGEGGFSESFSWAREMGRAGIPTQRIPVEGTWSYNLETKQLALLLSATGTVRREPINLIINATGRERKISGIDMSGESWRLRRMS
jgi:hypothetical protein